MTITIVDLPADARRASTGSPQLRLKVNHHFRVAARPGAERGAHGVHANPRYVF